MYLQEKYPMIDKFLVPGCVADAFADAPDWKEIIQEDIKRATDEQRKQLRKEWDAFLADDQYSFEEKTAFLFSEGFWSKEEANRLYKIIEGYAFGNNS